MLLPIQQSSSQDLMLMQTKWASVINPVLKNPTTDLTILSNVALTSGDNVINTTLGQTQQGWVILDITAAATIYRSAPLNDKTLTLHSSAPCTVTIGVF